MLDESTGTARLLDSNERTRVVSVRDPQNCRRDAPLGPREAFLVAHERLALLARIASGPSFVVAAVAANARITASLVVADRRALILGRHSQCGLRIEDDTVALRQVAALVRAEGARPVLHVRDLGTALPFVTEDGSSCAGVITDGPLYLAMGSVAVWFLPCPGASLPERAEEAWNALAPRTFLDRRAPEHGMRPAPVTPRVDDEITFVTRVAAPLLLGEDDDPEVAWGTLKLVSGARRVKRAISAERLEQGVLLGRYGRCGLLIETPENSISRVHVLLLRLGAEVWIIDTASTNGVKRGETEVLAEVLRDEDVLTLGREVALEWSRIQHAEA
jgi:FHA domain-containing protein